MSIRRSSLIALATAATTISCSRIFPATKNDGPVVSSARPRVERETARRREGSDVTLPTSADPRRLISALVPCDPADSAATAPRMVSECQHVDPKGDILRPRADTGTLKRP